MKLKNARSDAMQEYEWQNLLLILVLKAKRGDQRRRCEGKNPESYKTHTNTTLTTHGFFMLLAKSNLHGGGREWTLDSLKKSSLSSSTSEGRHFHPSKLDVEEKRKC